MEQDILFVIATIIVFAAGFACGRLDRSIRRIEPLSAEEILRMLREPADPTNLRAGGML